MHSLTERLVRTAAIILVALHLSGCAWGILNFVDQEIHHSRTTTIGQELLDLEKAYEAEVITEEEYDATKKELMRGGPGVEGFDSLIN